MRTWRSSAVLLLVVGVASATLTASLASAGDTEARRAEQIAAQLSSPFCPGKTLEVCTSSHAAAWRADIRRWVEEGVPTSEVKARLQARAGHPLAAIPAAEQAVWLPALTTLLGLGLLGLLFRWARRSRRTRDTTAALPLEGADESRWDARLDEELRLLD